MGKRLFLNSDVTKIVKLAQRQVVHWTEKELVIPLVEAKGAGSKRKYTYTNLLEFSICKTLFDMGLGIHKVKQIAKDLRQDGHLTLWAEDYPGFLKKVGGRGSEEQNPESHHGILLITFSEHKSLRQIIPYNISYLMGYKSYFHKILSHQGLIIINLGHIKIAIDSQINKYMHEVIT
ncbi:MAG: MerR family transcriptional regulator [bacterium]